MSKNAPFRYDFVGSFLRPAQLKQARADFESGKISEKQLISDKRLIYFDSFRSEYI